MALYPDGPCRDTGAAKVVVKVNLLPCPDGFTQNGEICTCEDRLHQYDIKCTITNRPLLMKSATSIISGWVPSMSTQTMKVSFWPDLVQQSIARKTLSDSHWRTQMISVTSIVLDCCVGLVLLTTASCLAVPNVKSVPTPT